MASLLLLFVMMRLIQTAEGIFGVVFTEMLYVKKMKENETRKETFKDRLFMKF